jgi:hypothetical protein
MGKQTTTRPIQARPKNFGAAGRSFPTSGEEDSAPEARKVMAGGYGVVSPSNRKESAIVKKSRAQLIHRLGILPRKSK